MRYVTLTYSSGLELTWKCSSASYGHASRNALLFDAISPKGVPSKMVLLPLHNVLALMEAEEKDG